MAKKEDGPNIDLEYKQYLDEREGLENARFRVAESFDKALLTLSGGALALSMTFITDIASNPIRKGYLVLAWLFFGMSLVILLLNMYFCQLAYEKERKKLDAEQAKKSGLDINREKNNDNRNIWGVITRIGNCSALVLFAMGVIVLSVFIFTNMKITGEVNEPKTTKTTSTSIKTNSKTGGTRSVENTSGTSAKTD